MSRVKFNDTPQVRNYTFWCDDEVDEVVDKQLHWSYIINMMEYHRSEMHDEIKGLIEDRVVDTIPNATRLWKKSQMFYAEMLVDGYILYGGQYGWGKGHRIFY